MPTTSPFMQLVILRGLFLFMAAATVFAVGIPYWIAYAAFAGGAKIGAVLAVLAFAMFMTFNAVQFLRKAWKDLWNSP